MNRGAWQATVHGVAKSRIRLELLDIRWKVSFELLLLLPSLDHFSHSPFHAHGCLVLQGDVSLLLHVTCSVRTPGCLSSLCLLNLITFLKPF